MYPTLAVFDILKGSMPVEDAIYVGSRGRAEEEIVPRAGIPIRYVRSAPIHGRVNPLKTAKALFDILWGTAQAFFILLKFRPNLIVAAGGYVSAPVVFASVFLRLFRRHRLVMDEQNLVPGLMNKTASFFAHAVFVSFPETPYFIWSNRCVMTGYPVRAEVVDSPPQALAKDSLGVPRDTLLVLVHGGSMGSRTINRLMVEVIPRLGGLGQNACFVHSTGMMKGAYNAWDDTKVRLLKVCSGPVSPGETPGGVSATLDGGRLTYRLEQYLFDMPLWLSAADLVVCRGGAGTLAELAAMGKPALVIPKRGLPGDHQELNGIHLAEKGGCEVVFEREDPDGVDYVDTGEFLPILLSLLDDPEKRSRIGARAREQFQPDFRERITDAVESLLRGEDPDFVIEVVEPPNLRRQRQVDVLVEHLRKQRPDSFLRRFYAIKMDGFLQSGRWAEFNKGVKLCGALKRWEKIPLLVEAMHGGNGFVRRNILRALANMELYDPAMAEIATDAMRDGYFEVRAEGVALAHAYHAKLAGNPAVVDGVRRLARRRSGHFEVRCQAIRSLPFFVPLDEYFRIVGPYRFSQNVRLREAILEGLRQALGEGRVYPAQMKEVRHFLQDFLITTSSFKPNFSIRAAYKEIYDQLAPGKRREESP